MEVLTQPGASEGIRFAQPDLNTLRDLAATAASTTLSPEAPVVLYGTEANNDPRTDQERIGDQEWIDRMKRIEREAPPGKGGDSAN